MTSQETTASSPSSVLQHFYNSQPDLKHSLAASTNITSASASAEAETGHAAARSSSTADSSRSTIIRTVKNSLHLAANSTKSAEDNEGLHGGTSIGMAEFQSYQNNSATTSVFGNNVHKTLAAQQAYSLPGQDNFATHTATPTFNGSNNAQDSEAKKSLSRVQERLKNAHLQAKMELRERLKTEVNLAPNFYSSVSLTGKLEEKRPDCEFMPVKTGLGLPFGSHPDHIEYDPPPEPFYFHPDRKELVSQMRARTIKLEEEGTFSPQEVYDCTMAANYYPGTNQLRHFYTPKGPGDETLVFESRFETGNLRRAIKIDKFEYNLVCRSDFNTSAYAQWFYFSVSNTRNDVYYKFNMVNMRKPNSLYNFGMQPLFYSVKRAKNQKVGWTRKGEDVCYYKTKKKVYTMTFTVKFDEDHDKVYVAYCYPYSYTDLQNYIQDTLADPFRSQFFKCGTLCSTIAGNSCYLCTITKFDSPSAEVSQRRAIVITARVHPGETNASWMMQGVLEFLTGPSVEADLLRRSFLFKIVPMLNPDGVIVGNYRCSLSGNDLNRHWHQPSKTIHPTVYYTKKMIQRLQEEREVLVTVDLHGHSRNMNVFMYGVTTEDDKISARVLPHLVSKKSDMFAFKNCSFTLRPSKRNTMRGVVAVELSIPRSYTMEATFCGADQGPLKNYQFTSKSLESVGEAWCKGLLDLTYPTNVHRAALEIEDLLANPPDEMLGPECESEIDDSEEEEEAKNPLKFIRKVRAINEKSKGPKSEEEGEGESNNKRRNRKGKRQPRKKQGVDSRNGMDGGCDRRKLDSSKRSHTSTEGGGGGKDGKADKTAEAHSLHRGSRARSEFDAEVAAKALQKHRHSRQHKAPWAKKSGPSPELDEDHGAQHTRSNSNSSSNSSSIEW